MRRLFISSEELADILGERPKTIRERAHYKYYPGALGGGKRPYRFPIERTEKFLGLEPGTIRRAMEEDAQ